MVKNKNLLRNRGHNTSFKKEILAQVFSCEFCENLRTPFSRSTSGRLLQHKYEKHCLFSSHYLVKTQFCQKTFLKIISSGHIRESHDLHAILLLEITGLRIDNKDIPKQCRNISNSTQQKYLC